MFGMTDGHPTAEIWNWSIGARHDEERVLDELAGVLGSPVAILDEGDGVLCDVYHLGGDFPTLVDVYLPPAGFAEEVVASAMAVRLDATVLLPDDTLDPSRYVAAAPDGSLTAVHVDEEETDDGTERRSARPCACADGECARSRFTPTPKPERPAAA